MRSNPKAADYANGWPKLLREAEGLRVRLKREMNTGLMTLPAGLVGTLETSGNGWHLLRFRGDPCACCGCAGRVSRVSWFELEPVQ